MRMQPRALLRNIGLFRTLLPCCAKFRAILGSFARDRGQDTCCKTPAVCMEVRAVYMCTDTSGAAHCNTLQHIATHLLCVWSSGLCKCAPQRTTTDCNRLQQTATDSNTLQHTATHCNTPAVRMELRALYVCTAMRDRMRALSTC